MPKVTPFLWFDHQAHEAARFYVSLFPGARIVSEDAMSARFELGGQAYIAFNGGPHYKLNPAVSLFVDCPTQAEIDSLWARLTADGGEESQCGWLVDKFGLSWQVVPAAVLAQTMGDSDPVKAKRAVDAMMTMKKLNIAALRNAHAGV